MQQYAYIRVSTKEQNIERQLIALKPYGVSEGTVTISCVNNGKAISKEIIVQ